MELLQHLRREGFPWDERTCAAAALAGRLDTLKYARQLGCPWCSGTADAALIMMSTPYQHDGHNIVCCWALEHQRPLDEHLRGVAACYGNIEMLRLLRGQGCPWDERCCAIAATEGKLDCLKLVREHGCP